MARPVAGGRPPTARPRRGPRSAPHRSRRPRARGGRPPDRAGRCRRPTARRLSRRRCRRERRGDLEAAHLARQYAVLFDRLGARGLDDGDSSRPSGKGGGTRSGAATAGTSARSSICQTVGRRARRPHAAPAGRCLGRLRRSGRRPVGRPTPERRRAACWPVLQQDPTVVAGEQGSASGVGRGRAVSRPSVVTHEGLELERRQRGERSRWLLLARLLLGLGQARSP